MSSIIRYLDVCSGYSAFTLGAQGLGYQCVGYSEIEAFPRAILEQRHGAVAVDWDHRHAAGSNVTPLFGDFTKIEAHHVGPVDLLTGGTPCQSFSVAGKRLGLDDPRGNLTLEFLALARRVRARWLVWENVPGILSHDGGRTMGTFLRLLGELGYGWAYRVLDAQYIRVDGCERAVPQRRRRVFVVAHLGDAAGPAAVLFERQSLRGDTAPRREAGEGIAPTLSARAKSGGGLGTDFDCGGRLIASAFGGGNRSGSIDAAACLTARGHKCDFEVETFVAQTIAFRTTPNDGAYETGDRIDSLTTGTDRTAHLVAHSLRAEGFDASEDGTGRGTPLVPVCIHADATERTGEAVNPSLDANGVARLRDPGMGISEGLSFGLTTGKPHAVAFSVSQNANGFAWEGDVAATLQARAQSPTSNQFDGVRDDWAVRRLTPTECERLMGVPDGFTAITYRGKPAADGPRYKALGNSQATNCMRWIAHGLRDVIKAQGAAGAERAA